VTENQAPDALPDPTDLAHAGNESHGPNLAARILTMVESDPLVRRYEAIAALEVVKGILLEMTRERGGGDDECP
jgi:hypothetical protein